MWFEYVFEKPCYKLSEVSSIDFKHFLINKQYKNLQFSGDKDWELKI